MIRRAIAAAALMVLAVPIHPQQTARFSIQGTIAAEKTDQPLSGVQVALSKDAERGTVPPTIEPVFTDDLGRFVFKDLDEGTYRVAVTLNGYVKMEYGQRSFGGQGTTLKLGKGEALKDLVVRLTRATV